MSYFSNVLVKKIPCYQCLCLAACRHKDVVQLMRACPDVDKYIRKKAPMGMYILETPDYSRLMNFLKNDQVSRK